MLLPQHPRQRTYLRIGNRIGWALVIFLGLLIAVNVIAALWFSGYDSTKAAPAVVALYGVVSTFIYMMPFMMGGLLFYTLSKRFSTERIRFEIKLPRIFPLLIMAGLGINFVASYINAFISYAIGYVMPDSLLTEAYDDPSVVIMYMTIAFAPAIAEEFLFRGVVYGNLRPYGKKQAVIISALLFALMHQNIAQLFYTFVCGIVMALMYEWTRSIWCSVLFHLFNNLISVLSDVLYNGIFGELASSWLLLFDGIIILLGAISTVILILYFRKTKKEGRIAATAPTFAHAIRPPEFHHEAVSKQDVKRLLLTPGMLVYCILCVLFMLFLYVTILINNLAGGGIL